MFNIYSSVFIEPIEAKNTICEIIDFINDKENISDVVNILYSKTEFDSKWLKENVGVNDLIIDYDEESLSLHSENKIPKGLLKRFYKVLSNIHDNVSIVAKCTDIDNTQLNLILIRDGIYTEEELYLNVSDYVDNNKSEKEILEENDVDINGDADYIESVYNQIVCNLKYEKMNELYSLMYEWCLEAILTKNFDYPISTVELLPNQIES